MRGRRININGLVLGLIALSLLAAAVFGCDSQPNDEPPALVISKGCLQSDFCLITLIVVPQSGIDERCWAGVEKVRACAYGTERVIDGRPVESSIIVRPRDFVVDKDGKRIYRESVQYEIDAHEQCHRLSNVQDLPEDPCHREDKGIIH